MTNSSTGELDSDQHMIAELEEAFKYRYTDEDEEYKAAISQPVTPPPVVVPWSGRPKRNYDWSSGRSGERSGWNRGGGGGYRDNYHHSHRGGGNDYGYRNRGGGRSYHHDSRYQDSGRHQDHYQGGRQPAYYQSHHKEERLANRRDNRREDRYNPHRRT